MAGSRFTCPECRATLRLAQEVPAGKHIKCPKCGASFAATAHAVSETVSPAAPPARDVDPAPRPRKPKFRPKKKSGGNAALIIIPIVAVALLVVIGGVVGAIYYVKGKKSDDTVAS